MVESRQSSQFRDGVSLSVSVTPLDIFQEYLGQFPICGDIKRNIFDRM